MRVEEMGINLKIRQVGRTVTRVIEEHGDPGDPTECWKRLEIDGNEVRISYLDFRGSLDGQEWKDIQPGSILVFRVYEGSDGFSLGARSWRE